MAQITPIHTLLIANRGEIACRIIRACRKSGIRSVAVYSEADRHSPHVKSADMAVFIGAGEVNASYLNQDKLIDAARRSGANAIHPGYGFLSENAGFAQRVVQEGFMWVGPAAEAIEQMGSKSNAKAIARAHEVPVIPGYQGEDQSEERLMQEAEKIGFPVLLKAAAGGGGKGMRIVRESSALREAIQSAKREALSAFGSDELLIEKYFPSARHIEIQLFGDKHGNAVHLLERECTVQRRYQKIFEESPSPVLLPETREKMGAAAVRLAKALSYDNAGTVEFIFFEQAFYFLEVNTRLQVEHPVTEAVTGLDLVELQIRCAEGHALPIKQEDIRANGYAIECRLYAEDPGNGFLPGSGTVQEWIPFESEGVRYDSGVESGSEISIYYDPMICKVIAHASDRMTAINRLKYALQKTVCSGLTTNQKFLIDLLDREDFRQGDYDTHFIENRLHQEEINRISEEALHKAILASTAVKCLAEKADRSMLKALPHGWRNNFYMPQNACFAFREREITAEYVFRGDRLEITVEGALYLTIPELLADGSLELELNGIKETFRISAVENQFYVHQIRHPQIMLELKNKFPEVTQAEEQGGYVSPMPATVVKILVQKGDQVKNGQSLLILSSMKMENTLFASEDGTVEDIFVAEGEHIEAGRIVLQISK
jgi:3-methylcrotonyl-CoA carboxylase alpha subunit